MTRKESGDEAEREVCEKVPCPNCGKQFKTMRNSQNLFDLRCENCQFRVQIKNHKGKPSSIVVGSGWNTMRQYHDAGEVYPPVMVNNKWMEEMKEHQEIRFYPFIKPENIKTRIAHIKEKNRIREYKMFDYIKLDELPYFVVYKS